MEMRKNELRPIRRVLYINTRFGVCEDEKAIGGKVRVHESLSANFGVEIRDKNFLTQDQDIS